MSCHLSTAYCHRKIVADPKGHSEKKVKVRVGKQRSCNSEKQGKEWSWEPREAETVGKSKAETEEVEIELENVS